MKNSEKITADNVVEKTLIKGTFPAAPEAKSEVAVNEPECHTCKAWRQYDDLRKELAEARAENERLLEVLEPFAARAGKLDGIWKDHETQWSPEYGNTAITVGHLRAASAAFRPPSKAKGEKK